MKTTKFLLLSLIILLSATAIFIGCRRDVQEPQRKISLPKINPGDTKFTWYGNPVAVGNSSNPYDNAGALHNSAMNILASTSLGYGGGNPTWFKNTMASFLANNSMDTSRWDSLYPTLNSMAYTAKSYLTSSDSYDALVLNLYITQDCRDYLGDLSSLISIGSLTSAISDESGNLVDACDIVLDNIRDLEDVILMDGGISEAEQKILLMTTSVARYSVAYYIDYLVNENNPWRALGNVPFEPTTPEDPGEPGVIDEGYWVIAGANWGRVADADVQGAGWGGTLSAMIEGFSGGTLAPFAFGAFLGMTAGYSAGELLSQIAGGTAIIIWVCC